MASESPQRTGNKRGHNNGILLARKQRRRDEADERQRTHAVRTPVEQLDLISSRPGGSVRERARIGALARTAIKEIE